MLKKETHTARSTHSHEFNKQKLLLIELDLMKLKASSAAGKGRARFIKNYIYWQRKSWVIMSLKHKNDFSHSTEFKGHK